MPQTIRASIIQYKEEIYKHLFIVQAVIGSMESAANNEDFSNAENFAIKAKQELIEAQESCDKLMDYLGTEEVSTIIDLPSLGPLGQTKEQ